MKGSGRENLFPKTWRRLWAAVLAAALLLVQAALPALGDGDYPESAFSPSLIAALRAATGAKLEFPLSAADPVFELTELDLSGRDITGLKGLGYFTKLISLKLDDNKLSTLSWGEFPARIRTLSLARNAITGIDDAIWPEHLVSLDLSNNRLTSPSYSRLPGSLKVLNLSNNFLTNKLTVIPQGCSVDYGGNFIYEANKIRPATLTVKDLTEINLSPGGRRAIPYVSITSSANGANPVPSSLIKASLGKSKDSPLRLSQEEYRFLVSAAKAGTDTLWISLALTDYTLKQYDSMNLTFHQVAIPVTVWSDALKRPGASAANNGDAPVANAVNGRSNNAVVDMTRFADGKAAFSPGLLCQLAAQDKKLILTHDFGNLTLAGENLTALVNQAAVSADAAILITLNPCEMRPRGFGPSRFGDKEIFSLQYKDFYFQVQLAPPRQPLIDLELVAPVPVLLYLRGQDFTAWDFEHLTAIRDNGASLDILGGSFDEAACRFSYVLNGAGRYGLATRAKAVNWLDLKLNSNTMTLADGTAVPIDPAPLLYKGSTMAPIRSVFEQMGAAVQWNEASKVARISYRNKALYIRQSGNITGTDMEPYTVSGHLLVPLRYISTELGATVLWWPQEGRIRIVY